MPAALPASWPAEQVSLVSLPFVAEELVLVHKPSQTLVVTDLCFNFGEQAGGWWGDEEEGWDALVRGVPGASGVGEDSCGR